MWLSSHEQNEISIRIEQNSGFLNCIGIVDGTLLPLEYWPTANGKDCKGRKLGYSVNAMIVCDDNALIWDYVVGWPGSTHDNRVWSNMDLCLGSHKYFASQEYVLGDSAFQPSHVMIPVFKKPSGAILERRKEFFNERLAKPKVKSEHCIGVLKGRFPFLKNIQTNGWFNMSLQQWYCTICLFTTSLMKNGCWWWVAPTS